MKFRHKKTDDEKRNPLYKYYGVRIKPQKIIENRTVETAIAENNVHFAERYIFAS